MVGSCGTGRPAHGWLRDRQEQRFVRGRACRETRHEQQHSTHQYRTLERRRPAKPPSPWARGAAPATASFRVAIRSIAASLKRPSFSMEFQTCPKTAVACFAAGPGRCDRRTRRELLYRSLRGHFRVRSTVRRREAKDCGEEGGGRRGSHAFLPSLVKQSKGSERGTALVSCFGGGQKRQKSGLLVFIQCG